MVRTRVEPLELLDGEEVATDVTGGAAVVVAMRNPLFQFQHSRAPDVPLSWGKAEKGKNTTGIGSFTGRTPYETGANLAACALHRKKEQLYKSGDKLRKVGRHGNVRG